MLFHLLNARGIMSHVIKKRITEAHCSVVCLQHVYVLRIRAITFQGLDVLLGLESKNTEFVELS